MSPDELVYLGVLVASISVGFLFRYLSPPVKQGAALLLGLSITIATCHIHALHSLVTVIGTWIIIKTSWSHAPALSLSWTFLYLLFFRLATWFGLPAPTPFANAIQLLLTLKMVSLANEVHSFHVEKKKDVSSFAKSLVVGGLLQEPSIYDILSYSYCYVGIMTGPFFRFQTYIDWVRQPSPLALPALTPCLQRLKLVPVYGALFLAVNFVFPLAYVRTQEFLDQNIFFRMFYMVAIFFVFRMRFYSAWCGAEACCISAGLGCYPEKALSKPGGGPTVNYSPDPTTEEKYDFKTIQNIDCYNTDFCVKVRHGMRYWNMTVQWWLHHYIYPNTPFKAYTLRTGWTMLISAYWHGLHAGYYLSFLTIPLCIAAESAMEAAVRAKLGPRGQNIFDWVHWFLKMRAYDYMCMGFVLLKASDTINYWTSIYFIMHIFAVCCIIVGRVNWMSRNDPFLFYPRAVFLRLVSLGVLLFTLWSGITVVTVSKASMNILPKKSWHVRNKDNVARVRRDEAKAAEEEREAKRRVERAEQEARTEYLRRKAQAALQSAGGSRDDDEERSGGSGALEHLNLFPLEESSEKKGNEEYLKEKKEEKEKQERAIGLLVSLGPQPGSEVTPWYLKSSKDKEESKEKEKRKGISEEEREKKDRRLKDSLDPLKDMKKALGEKDRKEHKSKKKEKRDKGEKRSSGESSIERLRAERLQREAEERRKAQALLAQRSGKGKEPGKELSERERPYNSAYFPELARKRQRRDQESWREEILKS